MRRIRRIGIGEARERAERAARLLAQRPEVRLVYLFGSAADDDVDLVRDVDLAVLSEPPMSFGELLRLRADLVAEVGEPLDLVSLNDAPILFARQVVDHGRCLYADRPQTEVDFVVRARARYWDFKPLIEESWRLIAERRKARSLGSQA